MSQEQEQQEKDQEVILIWNKLKQEELDLESVLIQICLEIFNDSLYGLRTFTKQNILCI